MEKDQAKLERAIFAGGCFWCMEPPFKKLQGVISVTPGYTDGDKDNPTYEEVCSGKTGHTEAIEIVYDPAKVSYEKLLEVLWMNIDPTDGSGQFVDRGTQYRSGIYYLNPEQKRLAEESKVALDKTGRYPKPVVTEIVAATTFYSAEDYHQGYYQVNPLRYNNYRSASGRDRYLDRVWGDDREKH